MANYATTSDFLEKYPKHSVQEAGVIDEHLTQAHSFIYLDLGGFLSTVEGDEQGLIALKYIEIDLAFESLGIMTKQKSTGGKIDAVTKVGDAARERLDTAGEWAEGSAGTLFTVDILDKPTFDMNDPETQYIDPAD